MTSTTSTQPEDLRDRMVKHIKEAGYLHSERIEQALRAVPRHRFVPAAPVEDAYANKAITIKPGDNRPASCASVPTVVAMMLGQLDLQPGETVLEIGAGTGYGRVRVLTGDGALGDADQAPYDKIIVTVGPWDLPPAWIDQFVPGGRLVVPLHWRGQARSVAFVHEGRVLRARDSQLCGFIPMIGIVPTGERHGEIATDVTLYWDTDQPIDPGLLQNVFTQPETTVWSGVTVVTNEPFDGIWLRLTATEPGTCRVATAIESGVCRPVFPDRSPAVVEGDSLAYLATPRRVDDAGERRYQLGATGHGPAGEHLAERLCAQIRVWDANRAAQPTITAYPAGTPDDKLPHGLVIDKQHTRLVLTT